MANSNSRMEKLHIYICLIAAFTVTVVCIAQGGSVFTLSVWLCVTIAAFYLIGRFIRLFVMTSIFPAPEPLLAEGTEEAEAGAGEPVIAVDEALEEEIEPIEELID